MTPATLRQTLATLGWTIRGLARLLDRPPPTVQNWLRPGYRVPDDVAAWLERRAQSLRDDPPPS